MKYITVSLLIILLAYLLGLSISVIITGMETIRLNKLKRDLIEFHQKYRLLKPIEKDTKPGKIYYEYDITHTFWVDPINGATYHVVDTIPVDTIWIPSQ